MYNLYCRMYQFAYKTAAPFFNWRKPELLEGENSLIKLPPLLKLKGIGRILIVTDKGITSIGLLDRLLAGLEGKEIDYVIYDETVPCVDPGSSQSRSNPYRKASPLDKYDLLRLYELIKE